MDKLMIFLRDHPCIQSIEMINSSSYHGYIIVMHSRDGYNISQEFTKEDYALLATKNALVSSDFMFDFVLESMYRECIKKENTNG